jgi:predicted permease
MWRGGWNGRTDGPRAWLTYGEYEQLRDHARSFSAMMASQSSLGTWQVRFEGDVSEEVRGRLVSGGFFDTLGVGPAIGRFFTAAADRVETAEIVISHHYWLRRFGGRPGVLGKPVTIRDTTLTIIGVAPRGFVGETAGQQPDIWMPLRLQPRVLPPFDWLRDTPPEKVMWLHVFGRLNAGVTLLQAEADANAVFRAGLQAFHGAGASEERRRQILDERLRLQPAARGASARRSEFSDSLTVLLAAVGILLLIACANLANLLLARGASRRTEMAVRLSLGASRGRLIRQLVTESLALAAAGGVAAIAVASMVHRALVTMLAEADPNFRLSFAVDPLVSGFLVAVSGIAALLFGLLPAWQATRTDARASLGEQGRGTVGSRAQIRSGRLLVCLQLALSLPLLVGAGLLVQTAGNLQQIDLGFPADELLLARVDLRTISDDDARHEGLRRELRERFQRTPGVRAVSFSQLGVFTGGHAARSIEVEGYVPRSERDRESAIDIVGPGYFSTLGVRLLLGRDILDSDGRGSAPVCIINEAFARRFFDRRNPIGLHVSTGGDDTRVSYRIVGVAANARTRDLRGEIEPRFFVPAGQAPSPSPTFLIRASTNTPAAVAAVRQSIADVNSQLAIMSIRSIQDRMAPLTAQDRTTARLALVFAAVALTLAAIGLYGVLSYGVARRTGEIAVRIALGARPGRVVSMILGETVSLVVAGLTLGAILAHAGTGLVDSRLYGVAARDSLTYALAVLVLLAVAAGAIYVPARRASKLEPVAALRGE